MREFAAPGCTADVAPALRPGNSGVPGLSRRDTPGAHVRVLKHSSSCFVASMHMAQRDSSRRLLEALQQQVIGCTRCPRLIGYCRDVARERRRMYRDQEYWGRPLPSFGDPKAELLILGLAPAAHGGNRTGRMFTGDRSGDFLYRALYEAGFSNQPESVTRDDGLQLQRCYVTASLRCAPPANKPRPEELRNCRPYLAEELRLLKRIRAVLALGRIAFDTYLRMVLDECLSRKRKREREGEVVMPEPVDRVIPIRRAQALPPRSSFRFAHGASFAMPGRFPRLFAAYHPSQQNTQTGKLTPEMFRAVLEGIRAYLAL
jgi:uracil-DNA glycosylase